MTTETPGNQNTFRGAALVGPLLCTAAAGLASVALGGIISGSNASAGAAIGAGMVCLFFAAGAAVIGAAARLAPAMSLMVAMLTYVLTVVLFGVIFAALTGSGVPQSAVDPTWLAGTVIGCTLVWLSVHIVVTMRARLPIYDLPSQREEADAR